MGMGRGLGAMQRWVLDMLTKSGQVGYWRTLAQAEIFPIPLPKARRASLYRALRSLERRGLIQSRLAGLATETYNPYTAEKTYRVTPSQADLEEVETLESEREAKEAQSGSEVTAIAEKADTWLAWFEGMTNGFIGGGGIVPNRHSCMVCGSALVHPSRGRKLTYCSIACSRAFRNARARAERTAWREFQAAQRALAEPTPEPEPDPVQELSALRRLA